LHRRAMAPARVARQSLKRAPPTYALPMGAVFAPAVVPQRRARPDPTAILRGTAPPRSQAARETRVRRVPSVQMATARSKGFAAILIARDNARAATTPPERVPESIRASPWAAEQPARRRVPRAEARATEPRTPPVTIPA